MSDYKLVLGLEIHLHIRTQTKMFCGCYADIYASEPNTHTCPVCLGLPGALPVPNKEAVEKTQLLGLALGCNLNSHSRFDRKHYFYPDLPKGYQISQYKQPLCEGTDGVLERIHLEEDTAKSFHEGAQTLIDFNKSGMPLVEIVTKPVFKSTEDAVVFCKQIQDLVRFLKIGDADMEKGQMRLEANISLRTPEMELAQELPEYKVEVKNINSFRFLEKAVRAEIKRQTQILTTGGIIKQENRGWNEAKGETVSQRDKEQAHDYRYFPEPDIPPMYFDNKYFEALKAKLPKLPVHIYKDLVEKYKLSEKTAKSLTEGPGLDLLPRFFELALLFEDTTKIANTLLNKPLYRELNNEDFISRLKNELEKVSDTEALESVVLEVIAANLGPVADYKSGKTSAMEFLVGMVMRKTKGKADANVVREVLASKLR